MCNLTIRSKKKTAKGYKVAFEREGSFYSFATGVRYNVGKVDVATKQNRLCSFINSFLLDKNFQFFNENMIGKTGIFPLLKSAQLYFKEVSDHIKNDVFYHKFQAGEPVILEMEIADDLMEGSCLSKKNPSQHFDVIAGAKIRKMKVWVSEEEKKKHNLKNK